MATTDPTEEDFARAEKEAAEIATWLSANVRELADHSGEWVAISSSSPPQIVLTASSAEGLEKQMAPLRQKGKIFLPLRVPTKEEGEHTV